ncbi:MULTISPECIES: NAD(P)/FAD-dependent oxidoreductase [unclassified Paenibacillus]|uniref:NAD(P)/FAD-dependent oxidoreductase n=1 Tax=unclassified Paenibacillus TaxID=185978 RepID=UPI001AE85854|nr:MULTISPECIES: NAD(P)/FAD-dependent oxidoreductase [unclassified Paenibacillus]MBP1156975.1 flavin-dependent dehydrogenase [Paenibacillus sp. PvP091]MBP1172286.1 flavin-dependent dehydrogenase [Paenibacillus sp. PvR098]MBP2438667.1 flavin-dependent dehydrogenase [Paenibacillus sp. PvP052]
MKRIHDVAVLGAGVAGSSVAKALADRGWDTVLIDRHTFPRHKVCGEFLSPESQSMLNALDLRRHVESLQPSCITRIRLIMSHGAVLDIPLPGVAIGVSRNALDPALHSAAVSSGVDVRTGTTVTSVSMSDRTYTMEIKREGDTAAFEARAVIAAWGANPRSGLPGYNSDVPARNTYMGVKSHFRGIPMEPVVELYFFSGGYLGLAPIEGGLVNAAALLKREAFRDTDKTIMGMIDAAARRNPKLSVKLAQAIPVPGSQAAVAPVNLSRMPVAWEGIPRVGDASLMVPPLCGDGMSMALRSARLCVPLADGYLRGEISLSRWQREYTQSIQREFTGPLRWGRLLQSLFSAPVVPRLLLGLAHCTPGLASRMVQATRLKERDG